MEVEYNFDTGLQLSHRLVQNQFPSEKKVIMTSRDISNDYEKRAVVFLDILGFKQLLGSVGKDRISATLGLIHNITDQKNAHIAACREITNFSDSIVMSYAVTEAGAFRQLIRDIVRYQKTLIGLGYALRGAIEIGELYHRGGNVPHPMIFGNGFVKAYELENTSAIYPRVILSDEVWEWGLQNPSADSNDDINTDGGVPFSEYVKNKSISRDFDGYRFINVLGISLDHLLDTERDFGFVEKCRDLIIQKLRTEEELRVLNKWRWFANYFNKAVEQEIEISGIEI